MCMNWIMVDRTELDDTQDVWLVELEQSIFTVLFYDFLLEIKFVLLVNGTGKGYN